jgi:hypothetical protein
MIGFEKVEKQRGQFAVKCKCTKCTRVIFERILAQKQSSKVIRTFYLQKLQLFTEFVLTASDIMNYMYSREQ